MNNKSVKQHKNYHTDSFCPLHMTILHKI